MNIKDNRLRRIQRVGRILKVLCVLLFAFVGVVAAYSWAADTSSFVMVQGRKSLSWSATASLTGDMTVRLALPNIVDFKPEYAWVKRAALWLLLAMSACYLAFLYRLFDLYGRGVLFARENAQWIKLLGMLMLINWGLDHLAQLLQPLAVTAEKAKFGIGFDRNFFGALFVFMLAWIVEEAKKIDEDQRLTI